MSKNNVIKVLTRQEEIELLQRAQKGRTMYDILGLSHNASEKKIKEAYENKLKNKEKSKDKFQEIQEAYEVLSDKKAKALYDKKNKDLFLERDKAIRLLIYYNQSFVKYMVKGYHYPQGEINADELTAEGVISLPKAINDFDLAKSENRMASFAGHWIRHHIRSFIIKSRILPQATPKKKLDHSSSQGEETEKKVPPKSSPPGIIYYDKIYQSSERDDKVTSLLDTLADKNEEIEQQIRQKEVKEKTNETLALLEPHEELITRLFFGVSPTDLSQINRLATEEKAKELKKLRVKSKKKSLLFEKYSSFFATPCKKEEVVKVLMNREFWEYFREFPELATKEQTSRRSSPKTNTSSQSVNSAEKKKWYSAAQNNLKDNPLSEKMVLRWISLGYQPEDINDSQNQILQKIGISKKEKEQWQKTSSKAKNKDNWLEQRLGKVMENWKKNILKKLKELTEKTK